MNRPIEYRALTKDGKWVRGVPVESVNEITYMIVGATEDAINTRNEVDFIFIEVIPETVGQYTGLIDIKGQKIYEGDLLHVPLNPWTAEEIHKVYFEDAQFRSKSIPFNNLKASPFSSMLPFTVITCKATKIGTIHDDKLRKQTDKERYEEIISNTNFSDDSRNENLFNCLRSFILVMCCACFARCVDEQLGA